MYQYKSNVLSTVPGLGREAGVRWRPQPDIRSVVLRAAQELLGTSRSCASATLSAGATLRTTARDDLDDGPLKEIWNARSTNPRLLVVLLSCDVINHLVEGTRVPFPFAIPQASTNFIFESGESTHS